MRILCLAALTRFFFDGAVAASGGVVRISSLGAAGSGGRLLELAGCPPVVLINPAKDNSNVKLSALPIRLAPSGRAGLLEICKAVEEISSTDLMKKAVGREGDRGGPAKGAEKGGGGGSSTAARAEGKEAGVGWATTEWPGAAVEPPPFVPLSLLTEADLQSPAFLAALGAGAVGCRPPDSPLPISFNYPPLLSRACQGRPWVPVGDWGGGGPVAEPLQRDPKTILNEIMRDVSDLLRISSNGTGEPPPPPPPMPPPRFRPNYMLLPPPPYDPPSPW